MNMESENENWKEKMRAGDFIQTVERGKEKSERGSEMIKEKKRGSKDGLLSRKKTQNMHEGFNQIKTKQTIF